MSFTERYRFLGLSPPSRERLAASDIAGFPDAVYQYEFNPIIQLDAPSQPLAGVGIPRPERSTSSHDFVELSWETGPDCD
jgi:hypothetical protein